MTMCNGAGGEFISSKEEVAIIIHVAGRSACDLSANVELRHPLLHTFLWQFDISHFRCMLKREQVRMGQYMRHPVHSRVSSRRPASHAAAHNAHRPVFRTRAFQPVLQGTISWLVADVGACWACEVHEWQRSRTQADRARVNETSTAVKRKITAMIILTRRCVGLDFLSMPTQTHRL